LTAAEITTGAETIQAAQPRRFRFGEMPRRDPIRLAERRTAAAMLDNKFRVLHGAEQFGGALGLLPRWR